MLAQKEYFEIFIYNNEIAVVEKIDDDIYNYFKGSFEDVYHAKNGDAYALHENVDAGIDMIIVDYKHLNDILYDLQEQGFCEKIDFNFIDDYFNGNYTQYIKAF